MREEIARGTSHTQIDEATGVTAGEETIVGMTAETTVETTVEIRTGDAPIVTAILASLRRRKHLIPLPR